MNPNEKPKGIWNPVWPSRREALLRLFLITLVLFPLSWAVNALLIGSWRITINNEESRRHFIEWHVIWIAAVVVIFLVSLLPAFRRVFSRQNARRFFLALICFVTVAALFYAEENWRGARAWRKYREQLESQGAQLDYTTFTPKPVPDDQNFAATPLVLSWFSQRTNTARWEDNYLRADQQVYSSATNKNRSFTDLVAWEMAFVAIKSGATNGRSEFKSDKLDLESRAKAAPAVLEALKDSEADLAELRSVSARPYSRYPIVYDMENPWEILLPHLQRVRQSCLRLRLKACAELAAGKSDEALADVKLMHRLADSIKEEPFLVSYLVRMACVQLATQPVWEGLAEHRWSDAQLDELQKRFTQLDFVTDMKWPLDSERAVGTITADLVRKKGIGMLIELIGPGQPSSIDRKFANWCGGFVPKGWYYLEQVNLLRLYEMQLDGTFNPAKKRISPNRIEANLKELERELSKGAFGMKIGAALQHRFLAIYFLPALSKIPEKAAVGQTTADHTALACALERFRLTNGSFPETLGALVPKYISSLPTDALTGEPYNYRKTADGQFILYSVGWNGKSEEGAPGKTIFDIKTGDWVWQYPSLR